MFIREGLSWSALFFAPLWLLSKKLWLEFTTYLIIAALLIAGSSFFGLNPQWVVWGLVAMHLIIAIEADTVQRAGMRRAGWRTLGAVTGQSTDECERRFFEAWMPDQPAIHSSGLDAGTLAEIARQEPRL